MEDFLLKNYSLITSLVECLAAVTGLILYAKYRHTAVKYFIWFLVYLSICDFFSLYTFCIKNDGIFSFLEGTALVSNYWWTTLYWKIGAILFFGFYYNQVLTNSIFKKIIKSSTYSFLLFSIGYILTHWQAYFKVFFPIISVLGAIVIFMCSIFYFLEILLSDRILTFYRTLDFYISLAIFIWWLIVTPIVFYEIYGSHGDENFRITRKLLYLIANVFMYLTFTFALMWCRPKGDVKPSLS
ncbi:hypothetical protein NO995_08985 [Aestuariibaculum sp. M13]|uniref:hypothetical protein n=1 Tax=Aestuariibaculum sp. M13 TaxID=2967132 RepID=UPI002159DEE3|nr:hypothetical protein [Aestuariibaculum sp. M13]MCR8667814.1 hypothetical protein [Aestuariibaculum sp. M13]